MDLSVPGLLSPGIPGITLMRMAVWKVIGTNPDFSILVSSCDLPPAKNIHITDWVAAWPSWLREDENSAPVPAYQLTGFWRFQRMRLPAAFPFKVDLDTYQ